MQNPENDFSPLLVDQQIEYPTTLLPRGEAHLIHDLQGMYDQENSAAIDRVRMRLVHQQPETRTLPQQKQSPERISQLKQRDVNPVQRKRGPRPVSAFVRRLNLLAAVLIVGLLVGSLTFVFALFHGGSTTTHTTPDPLSGWGKVAHVQTLNDFRFNGHVQTMNDFGFNGLAWSPDSKRVAASSRVNAAPGKNIVRIWDATTGQHLVNVQVNSFVNTISWSPNNQQVAIATGQGVIIVDGQNGDVLHTLTAPSQPAALVSSGVVLFSSRLPTSSGPELRAISWSPDGSQIAASSFGDTTGSSVLVWNLHTGGLDFILPVKSNNGIEGVSWSSDGKYIAADTFQMTGADPLSQSGVIVWNVATHRMVLQKDTGSLPDVNVVVAWQPGTHTLAQIGVVKAGSGYTTAILIFDGTTGKTLKELVVPVSDVLSWSPNGKYLAYTSPADLEKGNMAQILNTSNWSVVYTYKKDKNIINELAWSPNGHYIATGESIFEKTVSRGVVRVWETLN